MHDPAQINCRSHMSLHTSSWALYANVLPFHLETAYNSKNDNQTATDGCDCNAFSVSQSHFASTRRPQHKQHEVSVILCLLSFADSHLEIDSFRSHFLHSFIRFILCKYDHHISMRCDAMRCHFRFTQMVILINWQYFQLQFSHKLDKEFTTIIIGPGSVSIQKHAKKKKNNEIRDRIIYLHIFNPSTKKNNDKKRKNCFRVCACVCVNKLALLFFPRLSMII